MIYLLQATTDKKSLANVNSIVKKANSKLEELNGELQEINAYLLSSSAASAASTGGTASTGANNNSVTSRWSSLVRCVVIRNDVEMHTRECRRVPVQVHHVRGRWVGDLFRDLFSPMSGFGWFQPVVYGMKHSVDYLALSAAFASQYVGFTPYYLLVKRFHLLHLYNSMRIKLRTLSYVADDTPLRITSEAATYVALIQQHDENTH